MIPSAFLMSMQTRKHLRKSFDSDAIAYLGLPVLSRLLVKLIDISNAGLSFSHFEPLQSGVPVLLTFCAPGSGVPCTVQSTVVYSSTEGSKFRIGLQMKPDYGREVLV